MGYSKKCPKCGSNLDPGEHCECNKNEVDDKKNTEDKKEETKK